MATQENLVAFDLPDWPEVRVESWLDFVSAVDRLVGPPGHTRFVFRGQPDANDPLQPTLIRWPDQIPYELLEIEKTLQGEIQRVAHLYHNASHLPRDKDMLGWWALMQHYNVPTRMLDWTASAYVAAHFATSDPRPKDGAVWLFNISAVLPAMALIGAPAAESVTGSEPMFFDDTPARKPFLYVYRQERFSDRSWAQQGLFTVSTDIIADHGTILRSVFRHQGGWQKIIIPSYCPVTVIMDISHETP